MKLHWCCGDVYLKGYINLDIVGILREQSLNADVNDTTLDNYYARPFDKKFEKRDRQVFIVDQLANILEPWPFAFESIDEIVMISCWEHFFKHEVLVIKREIERVLKPGGRLIVDFPDLLRDIGIYYFSDPEFMMELIYCNGKDERSIHKWGYTPATFRAMWDLEKFEVTNRTIVQHDYPMIGMEVKKK